MNRSKLFMLLLFALFSSAIQGQNNFATRSKKAIIHYQDAAKAYEQMLYTDAINELLKAIEKDPKFVDAYLLMAEIFRAQDSTLREIDCYKKAIEIDESYFQYVRYNLATAYWNCGEYNNCIDQLKLFISKGVAKPITLSKANNLLLKAQNAQVIVENPVPFKPVDLGPAINDPLDQYWPSLSIDGKTLVFTVMLTDSTRKTLLGTYAHQEDFFMSRFENDQWQKAIPIGPPINSPGNEGAQQISADGKTLVFTGCQRPGGFGNCDIYFSYFLNDEWTVPENGGHLLNSSFSEKQPALSADGQTIYFASDRPGGMGGMDLWMSKKSLDGQWLLPVNMGRVINTPYDEASPFLHADNKSFYFSSDGHPGLGKKDIFYTTKKDSNQWKKPVNIGFPINSFRDEIGLVINQTGEQAYYSSNIFDQNWNIFQFELPADVKPNPVSYALGNVSDAETKQVLEARVELMALNSGDTVARVVSSKYDGTFLVCLPAGASYALTISHPGYLFKSLNFNLEETNTVTDPYLLEIQLVKPKPGEAVVLENIFFETNSFKLLRQSEPELHKLIEFINQNPTLVFEIGGHTDNAGTTDYNKELSEKRAKSVYDYILPHLLPTLNISYKGFGELQPVNDNLTEESRAKNRRTELKILGSK